MTAGDGRTLGDHLTELLLSDPPATATKAVMDWASRQSPPITDPGPALDEFRARARRDRARAGDLIRARLSEDGGIEDALTAVNARGVPTALRLSVLDQIADRLEPRHVRELARVSARQHAQVVLRARDILVRLGTAEAMYALVRILGRRDDEAGRLAVEAGVELGNTLPAVAAVRAGEAPDEIGGEDLFYAALALPTTETSSARSAGDVRTIVELVAADVDAALQASGRTVGGLSDYEQALRDDVHALVLAWRLARDEPLEGRAVDTVLRSGSADDVAQVVADADVNVSRTVATRALDRSRRRHERFAVQAVGAMRGLRDRDDVRRELRSTMVEALEDDELDVRTAAIEALATDADDLEARERRAVALAYAALPTDRRATVSSGLGQLGREVVALRDAGAIVDWARGASPADASLRAGLLAEALQENGLALDDATDLLATIVMLLQVVGGREGESIGGVREIALHILGAVARNPPHVEPLLAIPGVLELLGRSITASDLEAVHDSPRPLLVAGLLRTGQSSWLAADEPDPLVLDQVLAHVAADVPGEWDDIVRHASERVRRRLLRARLLGLALVLRELEQLERAEREQSAIVLSEQRDAVIGALNDAEAAARGNPGLLEQLAFVRQAVVAVASSDPPDDRSRLEAWHARISETVGVRRHGERLEVSTSDDDVLSLLLEADVMAHGRDNLSPAGRTAVRRDLVDLVDGLVAAGYGPGGPHWTILAKHLRGRNELTRLVWGSWSSTLEDAAAETAAVLIVPGGSHEAAMRLDALVRRLDDDGVNRVADAVAPTDLETASLTIGRLLRAASRARDGLRERVGRSREAAARRIGEELRLPLRSIESTLFGYFRLRAALTELGWRQIAPSLGDLISREQLDPQRQDVRGDVDAQQFRVRTLGLEVDGEVIDRVIVEGVGKEGDEQEET
jgi:hypothetical protein